MIDTRVSFRYLAKRILVSLVVVWMLVTLIFFLLKSMPGDITTLLLNPNLEPEAIRKLKARYGLDEPLWKQYLSWMGNYLVLNFGYSLKSPERVLSIILTRLPRTLILFGTAFLLQYTIGVIAGIQFGWRRGSTTDKAGFISGLTLYSIPFFWVGWLLLYVFAYKKFGLGWLPLGQMTAPFKFVYSAPDLLLDVLYHMILPAGSLLLVGWAGAMLVMRTSMQEVTNAPYIQTARAKGLPPTAVKYKHAARNAMIPVMTQAIVGIAFAIDGSVIVETVFSWPGIGALLVKAILQRNFTVAMASFFFLGVLIVVLRLLTDVLYTYLDPRIKFGEAS